MRRFGAALFVAPPLRRCSGGGLTSTYARDLVKIGLLFTLVYAVVGRLLKNAFSLPRELCPLG